MNSNFVKNVKKNNPDKNIKFNEVGGNITTKFKEAVHSNKEFIKALIFIGKNILDSISLPVCIKKLGYDWGEIGKEGLYLVKKAAGSLIRIDCIPFDILGFFSIQKTLASLGIKIPLPNLEIINKILKLSTFNPLPLIKEMLTFDPLGLKCIAKVDKWKIKDYVYNCLKSSNQS